MTPTESDVQWLHQRAQRGQPSWMWDPRYRAVFLLRCSRALSDGDAMSTLEADHLASVLHSTGVELSLMVRFYTVETDRLRPALEALGNSVQYLPPGFDWLWESIWPMFIQDVPGNPLLSDGVANVVEEVLLRLQTSPHEGVREAAMEGIEALAARGG